MSHPISSRKDALANIASYQAAASVPEVARRMRMVHTWCATRANDRWLFGQAKFVGFLGMTAARYLAGDATKFGRREEAALIRWFDYVQRDSRLGREVHEALADFLGAHGHPAPRSDVRIMVDRGVEAEVAAPPGALTGRISVDPEICGGRPCIRGTRVRVIDILDMLAGGANEAEILDDLPYLAPDDIRAALAYAARSLDHRVVEAA